MALPSSGAISFNAINVELGQPGTTSANINQSSYRTLAGVPSGTIALSNFYGKANQFSFTISSPTSNANLRSLAVAAGWGQSSAVVATINSGVYVYSTGTGTPGLTVDGSWPGGVSLINNGYIVGQGGSGGRGYGNGGSAVTGGTGGTALSVSVALSVTNNNIIGGGGGGGGGGGAHHEGSKPILIVAGGGGGGGQSYNSSPGGAGGLGDPGWGSGYVDGNPGNAGSSGGAGNGGTSGHHIYYPALQGGPGGSGGGYGSSGSGGSPGVGPSQYQYPAAGGGSGGPATSGNANITWVATGTRYGPLG